MKKNFPTNILLGVASAFAVSASLLYPLTSYLSPSEVELQTWAELQTEMRDYISNNAQLQAGEISQTVISTFPHLATQGTSFLHLLPIDFQNWQRVHWTMVYSAFILFHDRLDEYSKEFKTNSIMARYNLFIDNSKYVHGHNLNSVFVDQKNTNLFELEMNSFGDQSLEELRSNGYFQSFTKAKDDMNFVAQLKEFSLLDSLPENFDWRDYGCVQKVKNQAHCGSCWAFSVVEAVESAVCVSETKANDIKLLSKSDLGYPLSQYLPNLSEQQLVDCGQATGNQGCNGGLMEMGFEYIRNLDSEELCTEEEYAYTAQQGTCQADGCKNNKNHWRLDNWNNVARKSVKALKKAIYQNGAVSVSIEADHKLFRLYKRGVVHDKDDGDDAGENTCGVELNHGVNAVGYGTTDEGEKYWIVKNSWGPSWGEDGFVRIAMTNGEGECGILLDASYPHIIA